MKRRPGNYAVQAKSYDLTRGASPTVVRALAKHLGEPDGRLLLDIAGGTGNYAQVLEARGFRVVVVDAELEMVRHAARKLRASRCVVGDATALPFRDRSFDCATLVNAVHLIDDVREAFQTARRILRTGPFVLTSFSKENAAPLFVHEYFGLDSGSAGDLSNAELESILREAGFDRVDQEPFVYLDAVDGSIPALHTNALYLAGPAYLRNTSVWHRLDDRTRRRGLQALAADLRSGVLEARVKESFQAAAQVGHGTLFAAWP
jgi:SAM-dependent methyltransferase